MIYAVFEELVLESGSRDVLLARSKRGLICNVALEQVRTGEPAPGREK